MRGTCLAPSARMEHTVVATSPKYPVPQATQGSCTQCGEKLVTHRALPATRTEMLCPDCAVIDLPHTD